MTTQMGFSEMMQSLYTGSASLDYRKTGRLLREMEAQAGKGRLALWIAVPLLAIAAMAAIAFALVWRSKEEAIATAPPPVVRVEPPSPPPVAIV